MNNTMKLIKMIEQVPDNLSVRKGKIICVKICNTKREDQHAKRILLR